MFRGVARFSQIWSHVRSGAHIRSKLWPVIRSVVWPGIKILTIGLFVSWKPFVRVTWRIMVTRKSRKHKRWGVWMQRWRWRLVSWFIARIIAWIRGMIPVSR